MSIKKRSIGLELFRRFADVDPDIIIPDYFANETKAETKSTWNAAAQGVSNAATTAIPAVQLHTGAITNKPQSIFEKSLGISVPAVENTHSEQLTAERLQQHNSIFERGLQSQLESSVGQKQPSNDFAAHEVPSAMQDTSFVNSNHQPLEEEPYPAPDAVGYDENWNSPPDAHPIPVFENVEPDAAAVTFDTNEYKYQMPNDDGLFPMQEPLHAQQHSQPHNATHDAFDSAAPMEPDNLQEKITNTILSRKVSTMSRAPEDSPEVKRCKQRLLASLQKLARSEIVLSRTFDMQDSVEDMRYELELHQTNMDTSSNVQMMKFGIIFIFGGLEMVNERFGPLLKLKGLSESMRSPDNMAKFDAPLERMYYKIWKKGGSMNPFVELGILIVMCVAGFHFANQSKPADPNEKKPAGGEKGGGLMGGLGGLMGMFMGGAKPSSIRVNTSKEKETKKKTSGNEPSPMETKSKSGAAEEPSVTDAPKRKKLKPLSI